MRTLHCTFGEETKGKVAVMAEFQENMEWVEPFQVPEFFITHVGKPERIDGTDMMILACGMQRGRIIEMKYRVILPIAHAPMVARMTTDGATNLNYEISITELRSARDSH